MGKTNSAADFISTSVLAENIRLPLSIVIEEKKQSAEDIAAIMRNGTYSIQKPVCRLYAGKQCLGEGQISEKEGKRVFKLITNERNTPKGGKK
jgi:hypothetical protein